MEETLKKLDQLLEKRGLLSGNRKGEDETPGGGNHSTWEEKRVGQGSSCEPPPPPPPSSPKPHCIYCEKGFCCYRASCRLVAEKRAYWRKISESMLEEEEADSNNTLPPSSDEEEVTLEVSESEVESMTTLQLPSPLPSPSPPHSLPPLEPPLLSPPGFGEDTEHAINPKNRPNLMEAVAKNGGRMNLISDTTMAMNSRSKLIPPPPTPQPPPLLAPPSSPPSPLAPATSPPPLQSAENRQWLQRYTRIVQLFPMLER